MLRSSRTLVALLAAALPTTTSAATPNSVASPQSFKGEYTVSFLGLSIARSTFSSRYQDGTYSIDGTVSAAGLAKLFDDTQGTVSSKGTISGKKMVPQVFRADYTSGKKASVVDIRFANGAVTSTQVVPAPGKRDPKSWVPLGASDLAAVLDPMAATVIHADSPRSGLRAHGEVLRWRDARQSDADLCFERLDLGARLQGRYGHLQDGF